MALLYSVHFPLCNFVFVYKSVILETCKMPKIIKSTHRVRRHRARATIPYLRMEFENCEADDEEESELEEILNEPAIETPFVNEENIFNPNRPRANEDPIVDEVEDTTDSSDSGSININAMEENADSVSEELSDSDDDGYADEVVEVPEEEPDEVKELRMWTVTQGQEHVDIDKLLKILRRRLLPQLPKTAKTFLGTTSTTYDIKDMLDADGSDGEYTYFGIKEGLEKSIDIDVHKKYTIFLQFNVDGIDLTNSGAKGFWVISCKVFYKPDIYKPFPVAIYCGNSKPADLGDYLSDFVKELNELQANGIIISDQRFNVRIHCFICDMPARAFLKCTKGHGGFFACERCEVKGEKANNVTEYPQVDCPERTDESFRNQTQPGHHKGRTPLLRIRPLLNMIFIFVLDFMHLFCEGVMERLLKRWFVLAGPAKVGQRFKSEVSRRLILIRKCIPCEFQRKTRSLKYLSDWKATEFRFFLLYCGPIFLLNIINVDRFKNFLLLHVACRILCNEVLIKKYHEYAKIYLRRFFLGLKTLYFKMQVMNLHCVIHAADDIIAMGCSFSYITAFPFENFLGKLTSLIRSANRPLAQICRRLHELSKINPPKPQRPIRIQILTSIGNDILKVKYRDCILTTKSPENFVMLRDKTLMKINRIIRTLDGVKIECNQWKVKRSMFLFPTDSNDLYMWQLREKADDRVIEVSLNEIKFKMVKLSLNLKVEGKMRVYTMPLLHHDL